VPDPQRARNTQQLAIVLDHGSESPIYRQIVDHVWQTVLEGDLQPGNRLPTVRQLAIDLGVHPDTITRAYKELELLGVVVLRPGEGTFVGLKPPDRQELERYAELEQICREVLARTEGLGFTLDDLFELLSELQTERPDSKRRST
jgi:GntR family transcriptional regulator